MAEIDSRVVKALRESRNYTQDQFAKLVNVSKRQVAEWERKRDPGESPLVAVREGNLENLCRVLGKTPDELAGRAPISAGGQNDSVLNYELIEDRYGVRRDELIAAAPLLFLILARQSLMWREVQLERCRTEMDQKAAEPFLPSELWEDYVKHMAQSLNSEEAAIGREEIFTPSHPEEWALNLGNRFSDYLLAIGKTVDVTLDPGDMESHFPECLVFPRRLEEICGGPDAPEMPRAAYALASGATQLSKIPAELRDDSKRLERSAWLASSVREPTGDSQYCFDIGSMPAMVLSGFRTGSTAEVELE